MSEQQFDYNDTKKFTLTAFLAFVAVFCFLMLMMRCHGDYMPVNGVPAVSGENNNEAMMANTDTTAASKTAAEASVNVTLPDGTELHAIKGGIEDKLVAFLNDSTAKAGKDVWFDFDNLNFKTGSAELTNESYAQVMNIAAVLKAYPKLKIKIGGYTDKSGDSTANLNLSQSRATTVLSALQKLNANAAQLLGAEGYGSQFAKAAADAPDEERKKDRRISLSVREK